MGLYSWLILENQKYTMVRDFPRLKWTLSLATEETKWKLNQKNLGQLFNSSQLEILLASFDVKKHYCTHG